MTLKLASNLRTDNIGQFAAGCITMITDNEQ